MYFPLIAWALSKVVLSSSGDRADVRNVVILFTDGMSDNFDSAWQEAMRLRMTGTDIVVVGVNKRNFDL